MPRKRKVGRPKLKRKETKAYKERERYYYKGHKTALKIFVWKEEDMSKEGLSHFAVKSRPYIRKRVLRPLDRFDVPVEYIDSVEKIKQFIINQYFEPGVYIIRGFSRGKNKFHIKQVRLAKVTVFRVGEEFRANVSDVQRCSRYWFWKGK